MGLLMRLCLLHPGVTRVEWYVLANTNMWLSIGPPLIAPLYHQWRQAMAAKLRQLEFLQ